MAKRKKYPVLPNGFGTIRYLGKNRRNPYAVHPPSIDTDEKGNYVRPKAICYVDDWYVGFAVLNAWRANTYNPGDEITFKKYKSIDEATLDAFCSRILSDFAMNVHTTSVKKDDRITFKGVYDEFYEWKFGENAPKKLSKSYKDITKAAFKHYEKLHNLPFEDIDINTLQECVNSCKNKRGSIEQMILLANQMYKFAVPRKYSTENVAQYLVMPDREDDEHGIPYTEEELKVMWKHRDDEYIGFLLIMCYSGYRIAAYKNMEVNIDEMYFRGGVKTELSKNRIVPIHSGIVELVQKFFASPISKYTACTLRDNSYIALEKYGIARHTPHDCRHTFSWLCEKNGVSDNDRKRMMGHSFGNDITNGIYGHRDLEDLRREIEKIKIVH